MSLKYIGGGGSGGGSTYNATREIYVDSAIPISGDGTKGDPFKTIQEALDAIQDATGKPSAADAISGAWTPINLANYTAETTPEIWNVFVSAGRYDEDVWMGPTRNVNMIAVGTVVIGAGDLSDFKSTTPRHVIWHTSGGYARSDSTRPHLRLMGLTPGEVSSTQPAGDTGFLVSGDLHIIQTASPGPSDTNTSLYIESSKITGNIDGTKKSSLPINLYMNRFIVFDINIPNFGAVQLLESGEVDGNIIADYYSMVRDVEISKDVSFQGFAAALRPTGFFNCVFKKSGFQFIRRETVGTGTPANLQLDDTSYYWFQTNGGLLIEEDTGGGGRGVPSIILLQAFEDKWEDIIGPLIVAFPGATTPTLTTFQGNVKLYAFGIGDELFSGFHIPHGYSAGTDIFPHVHFAVDGVDVNTVKWEVEFTLAKSDGVFSGTTTITIETAASGVAFTHIIGEYATGISGTLLEPDTLIQFKLKRITNGGTDNADTVFGMNLDIHYQKKSLGTANKFPPF